MLQAAENADYNYGLAEGLAVEPPRTRPERIAADVQQLAKVTIRLAHIDRVPRFECGRQENDAEHSLMLGIVSSSLIRAYFPGTLDPGLAVEYSSVHDLEEIGTGIDVNSFNLTQAELDAKTLAEIDSLPIVLDMVTPEIAGLIVQYVEQKKPEARFVRLVDKLLPASVDILAGEQGIRVLRENCKIRNTDQLQAAHERGATNHRNMFPEPYFQDIHIARDLIDEVLQQKFRDAQSRQQPMLFDI